MFEKSAKTHVLDITCGHYGTVYKTKKVSMASIYLNIKHF